MEVRRGDGSVIAVEAAGEQGATPLLFCHGLADSRLSAHLFTHTARELGLRVVAPDRPGVGGTDPRRLLRLAGLGEVRGPVTDAFQDRAPCRVPHRSHTGVPVTRPHPGTAGYPPRRCRADSFTSTPAMAPSRSSAPPGRCSRRSPDKS